MARRLFITNGEWTTRHEIGEAAIVIGRDPNCDLFFVNQRLSRRHARIEPSPDGVLLVDLGSRNGVWVNERKIAEHLLMSGDSIGLGGLCMVYEEDAAEATLAPGQLDPRLTVAGTARDTDSTESPDATAMLPEALRREDGTVVLRDTEPDSEGAATVVLAGAGVSSPAELDASTRVSSVRGGAQGIVGEDTILLAEPEPMVFRMKQRWGGLRWQTRFSTALFGWSVLVGSLLAWLIGVGPVIALLPFGLLCAGLVAFLATVLARRLLVEPVVRLKRDTENLDDDESLSLCREYRELDELAESINRSACRTADTDRANRK